MKSLINLQDAMLNTRGTRSGIQDNYEKKTSITNKAYTGEETTTTTDLATNKTIPCLAYKMKQVKD
uniref:Uncharacterized protein n=1 Tax=Arundo donax TaxID=35708 RepID=A0A0A8Y1N1_ARUDO